MILSAHQPAYLPWLGYFDKIARSDMFVYLDTVQFEKNSYINRNKIKTPQGPQWLTIPVLMKGHLGSTLLETRIDERQPWRKKHLKAIHLNYRKSPRFEAGYPKLEALYALEHASLADLCYDHLLFWLAELGIERRLIRSSELPPLGKKSDLVLELCLHCGADRYISGALGRNYLRTEDFERHGVALDFQAYAHPTYPQLHGAFEAHMGILDFWMNGQDTRMISGGEP